MKASFELNEVVNVYCSLDNSWNKGRIVRVYDERTYEQEHYGDNRPDWLTGDYNETLCDVELENGKISRAHFAWGLQKIWE